MKLAIVLLSCFVAITLQQHDRYWMRSRAARYPYPYLYGGNDYDLEYNPSYERSGFPYYSNQVVAENRANVRDNYDEESPSSRRFFGGFNAINSLLASLKVTSTSFSTSVSTVSALSVVTCYTRTMFASTTACRRKRSLVDMIATEDIYAEGPNQHETLPMVELPRQGRDIDVADLIESSKQETVSGVPQTTSNFGRKERQLIANLIRSIETTTVTATITSYALSYSTSTSTNTRLGAAAALSCLPAGVSLC